MGLELKKKSHLQGNSLHANPVQASLFNPPSNAPSNTPFRSTFNTLQALNALNLSRTLNTLNLNNVNTQSVDKLKSVRKSIFNKSVHQNKSVNQNYDANTHTTVFSTTRLRSPPPEAGLSSAPLRSPETLRSPSWRSPPVVSFVGGSGFDSGVDNDFYIKSKNYDTNVKFRNANRSSQDAAKNSQNSFGKVGAGEQLQASEPGNREPGSKFKLSTSGQLEKVSSPHSPEIIIDEQFESSGQTESELSEGIQVDSSGSQCGERREKSGDCTESLKAVGGRREESEVTASVVIDPEVTIKQVGKSGLQQAGESQSLSGSESEHDIEMLFGSSKGSERPSASGLRNQSPKPNSFTPPIFSRVEVPSSPILSHNSESSIPSAQGSVQDTNVIHLLDRYTSETPIDSSVSGNNHECSISGNNHQLSIIREDSELDLHGKRLFSERGVDNGADSSGEGEVDGVEEYYSNGEGLHPKDLFARKLVKIVEDTKESRVKMRDAMLRSETGEDAEKVYQDIEGMLKRAKLSMAKEYKHFKKVGILKLNQGKGEDEKEDNKKDEEGSKLQGQQSAQVHSDKVQDKPNVVTSLFLKAKAKWNGASALSMLQASDRQGVADPLIANESLSESQFEFELESALERGTPTRAVTKAAQGAQSPPREGPAELEGQRAINNAIVAIMERARAMIEILGDSIHADYLELQGDFRRSLKMWEEALERRWRVVRRVGRLRAEAVTAAGRLKPDNNIRKPDLRKPKWNQQIEQQRDDNMSDISSDGACTIFGLTPVQDLEKDAEEHLQFTQWRWNLRNVLTRASILDGSDRHTLAEALFSSKDNTGPSSMNLDYGCML